MDERMEKQEDNIMNDLVGKVLAGEASVEELQQVQYWCALSKANQKYFDHCKTIVEKAALMQDSFQYDTDVAWKKLQNKIRHDKQQSLWGGHLLKVAAALLLLGIVGMWGYQQFFSQVKRHEIATSSGIIYDTLPDGTSVTLNKQTSLTVVYNALQKKATIRLTGEAKFNVEHNTSKKLIVETDGVFIRDIGTKFNVKAYPADNTIEVSVQEGEVQFYTDHNEGIFVKAGMKGIYNKVSKTFVIEKPDTNAVSYATKVFVFEDTNLQTIVDQLNAIYETRIQISDNIKNCKLTVNFNQEEIDTIADIIAETLSLRITKTPSGITLEGDGCE
jgi:ferric-dicitrate binding protein FerR (iron transport regulator)